jgi:ethanolamine ammonia-lyase small subunit
MADGTDRSLIPSDLPELVRKIRARTPARILTGRSGAAYPTEVQLELREAHAAARDAVHEHFQLLTTFGEPFVRDWQLFEVQTRAKTTQEFLLRPDWGRRFDSDSRAKIISECARASDLQIVIGDGLSVPAVSRQVPALLPLLHEGARSAMWKTGRTFVVRHCRVGILNEIGELLEARIVVLLIGERPGLATAESLSAYMAYRPQPGHTDSDRNLISNIHSQGVSCSDATARILHLAAQMIEAGASGYRIKEKDRVLP